jgi:hypothetical protein
MLDPLDRSNQLAVSKMQTKKLVACMIVSYKKKLLACSRGYQQSSTIRNSNRLISLSFNME